MPTSDGDHDAGHTWGPGEVQRTLTRIERTVAGLAGSVMTKAEFEIHMNGLRQQFKIIDDRHNQVVKENERAKADLEAERKARVDAEKEREKEQRGFRRSVILCVVASAGSVIIPFLSRGVGLS